MKFSTSAQHTVPQNKYDTINAYGITISQSEWATTEPFTLRQEDISSKQVNLDKIRTGNIIGFKEMNPNNVELTIRPYRINCIESNSHIPTKITLTPPNQKQPTKTITKNEIPKLQLFSIVRDHTIACLFQQPELTLATEL